MILAVCSDPQNPRGLRDYSRLCVEAGAVHDLEPVRRARPCRRRHSGSCHGSGGQLPADLLAGHASTNHAGDRFRSLICFAFNIGAFEAPLILGGGYPDTLPVLAWRYFQDSNYAFQLQGMAVVVSLALVSGLFLAAYLQGYRRYERARGRV